MGREEDGFGCNVSERDVYQPLGSYAPPRTAAVRLSSFTMFGNEGEQNDTTTPGEPGGGESPVLR